MGPRSTPDKWLRNAEIRSFWISSHNNLKGLIFKYILVHVLIRQEMVLSGIADSVIRHDFYSNCCAKHIRYDT